MRIWPASGLIVRVPGSSTIQKTFLGVSGTVNHVESKKTLWRAGMLGATTGVLAAGAIAICGCSMTRLGYETAPYQITNKDTRIEIREYPALTLVSTPMSTTNGEGGGFMRLFGYISGENEESQKISMTTPVFMEQGAGGGEMSFVIPKEVATNGAPDGRDPSVKVKKMAKGRYAVYRMEGGRSDKKIRSAKRELTEWIDSTQREIAGPFIVAGYDPPFTPSMLQRNEVLVRLRD